MVADNFQQWAKVGATTRLAALDQERMAILKAFPELRRASRQRVVGREKRKFSAAARKKMSEGMRKYWAQRKAQKG